MVRKAVLVSVLLAGTAIICMGVAGLGRAAAKGDKSTADKPPFVHVVIFHLRSDAPEGEADALIADAHEMLRSIPTVRDLRVGKPAPKTGSGLAKTDYQVGLMILFDDPEGVATYAKHPQHLKYVEKHGKYIELKKLDIYDFIDQKK
jgi:hypothetical protein